VAANHWYNLGVWTEATTVADASRALATAVFDAAEVKSKSVVLECGAGLGGGAALLAETYQPARVVAIERDPRRVAVAQVATRSFGARVEVQLGDATDLRHFADGTFTHVLAVDCAYFFAPRSSFWAEAHRVLAPGGTLAVADLTVSSDLPAMWHRIAPRFRIPAANLIDSDAYRRGLIAAGLTSIAEQAISDEVLTGFSQAVLRRPVQTLAGLRALDWPAFLITAITLARLRPYLRLSIYTADKPDRGADGATTVSPGSRVS